MTALPPDDSWAHRSQGMRCSTCMWFVTKGADHDTGIGRCRRHAPTMMGYPVVFTSDWCGDHKLCERAYAAEQKKQQVLVETRKPSRLYELAGHWRQQLDNVSGLHE